MSGAHTPGPWEVDKDTSPLRVLATDRRRTIVCDYIGAASNPTAQANARLIASAPELLEALREMVDGSAEMQGTTSKAKAHNERLARARAAIAKATGSA